MAFILLPGEAINVAVKWLLMCADAYLRPLERMQLISGKATKIARPC
jgi:hypothetical protein